MTQPSYGAQEMPQRKMIFCKACDRVREHIWWGEKAKPTCTVWLKHKCHCSKSGTSQSSDIELLKARLADTEQYNKELLERVRALEAQIAETAGEGASLPQAP